MGGKVGADEVIAALALSQGGRVSRGQLLRQGIGSRAIEHRLASGRLHRVQSGVYAVGHALRGRDGTWWEALLACGEDAVLSHTSAAEAWELRPSGRGALVELSSQRTGGAERPGIRLHRTRRLAEHERTELRGMPLTTPARTILDLSARLADRRVEEMLDRGEATRLLDLVELRRAIAEHRGRPGTPRLERVLGEYAPTVTRSELEDLLLLLCDAHGLPRPAMNARVLGYEVDACWQSARLVVELDGYAYHRSPRAFEQDRARDVALTVAGWRVLRFTYRQLRDSPERVAASIRSLLRSRSSPT